MSKVRLSIATSDYDHFADFKTGKISAEGIDANWLTFGFHEIFARFTANREWDVSELSFAKFSSLVTEENSDVIALPVFASRMFRLGGIYVNKAAGIKTPADLAGKKIGMPEWAQTAAVYTRGWLQHKIGVDLAKIDWYQAGTVEAGRMEKVALKLPNGLRLTPVPDKSLTEMVISGELDAIIIANPPKQLRHGHAKVERLFSDWLAQEEKYYEETGAYPIMHIIAMRKAILDDAPWIARNLYNAFETSKNNALARILSAEVSRYPVPWLTAYAERMQEKFGQDLFPFGIEPNRAALSMFLQYSYEQGVAHKLLQPDDIFPKGIMTSVKA
ncbi:MAG TPA: ABC transporter substrate-binding protein [Xanthobacteraceae bacterium]|jgi:4,5-dihydroxyphthalate decarboxylase|nr:ABC transporter substrate-binding protein [Xanthobacteraceae bacterium]